MIDTAKMSDDKDVENLDITYYDLDGKEIKDFDGEGYQGQQGCHQLR